MAYLHYGLMSRRTQLQYIYHRVYGDKRAMASTWSSRPFLYEPARRQLALVVLATSQTSCIVNRDFLARVAERIVLVQLSMTTVGGARRGIEGLRCCWLHCLSQQARAEVRPTISRAVTRPTDPAACEHEVPLPYAQHLPAKPLG